MRTVILAPYGVAAEFFPLNESVWTSEVDPISIEMESVHGSTQYPLMRGGRKTRLFTSNFTKNGTYRFRCEYDNDDPDSCGFIFGSDLWFDALPALSYIEFISEQVTADSILHRFCMRQDFKNEVWSIGGRPFLPMLLKDIPTCQWFHFEMAFHREDRGTIYYDAVHTDGRTEQIQFMESKPLKHNKQVGACAVEIVLGGLGEKGSVEMYTSNLKIAKW